MADGREAALIDTNVLVRHLVGEPESQASAATRYLATAETLLLADLVVAEVVYVLESVYAATRQSIATSVRAILAFPAIHVVDASLLLRAVELYEVERLDFAEAYVVASAERSGVGVVASFDRSIDRVATIRRVEPD